MIRKYIPIVSSMFLGEFARTMYFVVITWLLYQITKDPFYTGLFVSLGFIPGIVLNLFIGVIVDRFSRKFLAGLAFFLNLLAMIGLFLLILLHQLQPWQILLAHMIIQLMGSLFRPSIQAMTAEMFSKEQLPKIFSHTSASGITGSLIGATMGGIIVGNTSASIAFLIIIICYCISILLLVTIPYQYLHSQQQKVPFITDLKDGFIYLKSQVFLFKLFGIMFTGQLVFHTCIGFLSVYTIEYLKKSATIYGVLDASLSAGGIIAGLLGTWWLKINGDRLAARALVIVGIGLFSLAFAPTTFVAFFGVFIIGLGTTWVRVLLQSLQQMATAKNYHGRMASYRMLCNQGSVVLSGPIIGWIASSTNIQSIFVFLLIPVFLSFLISLKKTFKMQFQQVMEIS